MRMIIYLVFVIILTLELATASATNNRNQDDYSTSEEEIARSSAGDAELPTITVYNEIFAVTQSFDPGSPEVSGGNDSSAADIMFFDTTCTPIVLYSNEDLGLPDYANIDAFSDGMDIVTEDVYVEVEPEFWDSTITVTHNYSVSRQTVGLPGSLIESEALTDGASSDTYEMWWEWDGRDSSFAWIGSVPLLNSDASCISPNPPPQTDIDAICWRWDTTTHYPVFFSVDRATAESLAVNPADILTSPGGGVWSVFAVDSTLGLDRGDNINALAKGGFTVVSLSADSPTAQNDSILVGSGGLFFVPGPVLWIMALDYGLRTTDDLNAIRISEGDPGDPGDTSSCSYIVGDANGSGSYNGLDITYGVAYLKGGPDPQCDPCPIPPCDAFFYCGDVNGSCSYNGLDITYGVAYLKGGSALVPCGNCPPSN